MNGERKEVSISINGASVIKTLLIIVLFYILYLLRDLVLVVLTAVVIASAVEPAMRWFKKYRVSRLFAGIIIYLVIALFLFIVFYFLVPPLLSETAGFLSKVPQYLNSLDLTGPFEQFDIEGSRQVVEAARDTLSIRDVVSGLSNYLTNIPGGVFNTVSAVFGGVLSFVLIIIFSFYLAVREGGIDGFLRVVTPVQHQHYVVDLWHRSQHKIGLWMQGQILLVVIIGVLVYLGLTILGVKHAFLFAVLAGVFELIPLFGPILASIPAIAVSFIDGGLTLALIVAGVYIIIQQFENHLIYPLVVHKVVGVPVLLVILALIIGAQLAGFLGIILSVPIAAALMEFTNDIQKKNRQLEENGMGA